MVMVSRNKLSYPKRLFLWLLGYSLLLVGSFVLFQYHREKAFKASEIDCQLQLVNTYILNELAEGKTIAEMELAEISPFKDIRLSIIGKNGNLIYDNTIDSLPGNNHNNRKEIAEAMNVGRGYTLRRHSEVTGDTY